MRKAMTMVEMAIVLVVLGILLIMISKGKDLIEDARIKKDISAVIKVKNSVILYATQRAFPNNFNSTELINHTDLTAKDFKLLNGKFNVSQLTARTGSFASATTGNTVGVFFLYADSPSGIFACILDAAIDDGIAATGEIRRLHNATSGYNIRVPRQSCEIEYQSSGHLQTHNYAFRFL